MKLTASGRIAPALVGHGNTVNEVVGVVRNTSNGARGGAFDGCFGERPEVVV